MRPGYVDPHTHVKCNTYGLAECMEKGREFIRWDEKRREYENQTGPVRKGIGMAIFCYKTGVYPISLETASCRMILNQDGSMQLQMGATEIGQGADTVFTQMAAEVTGITEDKVNVLSTQDTDVSPFDTGAYASRQTYVSGMAVKKTGAIFKEKILDYAAYMLEKPQDTLDVRDNHIVDKETGTQLLPHGGAGHHGILQPGPLRTYYGRGHQPLQDQYICHRCLFCGGGGGYAFGQGEGDQYRQCT